MVCRFERRLLLGALLLYSLLISSRPVSAAELVIADAGQTATVIAVAESAGEWERRAAEDLAHYVELISGAKPAIVNQLPAGNSPVLVVGELAISSNPELAARLKQVAKPNPVLRSDAITLVRDGDRILLAGTNDESHYYAAAELLKRWGCRWYLPTEFGECIPQHTRLTIDALDFSYAPPFEVRKYWLSWVGDNTGRKEFMRRNMMNEEIVPSGHTLAKYIKDIVPQGKSHFNVPIADPATAAHVAEKIADKFAAGERIMLGLEDGIYESDSPHDKALKANLQDKYFRVPSLSDPFLEFYNNVSRILLEKHPDSNAKIGFLSYSNITIPPQRKVTAEKPLVAYLAAIDIDPIHGMDDPRSPPRQEYREMLYRWSEVMQGRVVIYDYDQGMLVWRDFPAPSIQAIRQDIKHYQQAGILGIDTESRGAMATIFLNLFVRAQLYWNPDTDVDALLAEFYPKFYGPAAEPMAAYWTAIHNAWENTIVTEHEHFLAPAIYTPELVQELGGHLAAAEALVQPLADKANRSRNEQQYLDRMKFMRLGYTVLDSYLAMARAAATEVDFAAAVQAGEQGLAAREQLTEMNGTFTTYKKIGERGPAWWPGEVQQYRDLLAFTDGTKGKLIAKLPLEWSFRRDPNDTGVVSRWSVKPVDLSWWNQQEDRGSISSHQRNPGHWEQVTTDLYLQAQGLITPDFHGVQGYGWYRNDIQVTKEQLAGGPVHVKFPGLFNECWLYVNGYLAGYRPQRDMWWYNDYRFEWDVDLSEHLKAGENTVALRIYNPHHWGGMFRRPFLYQSTAQGEK